MEENLDENLEGNKAQSYYDDKGKKIRDIVFGFFGGLFVCIIIGGIFAQSGAVGIWLAGIAYIIAIIIFLSKGRKYIAIGLILLAIVPLIVLGGCLLVIGG